jgi:hypothetical protein
MDLEEYCKMYNTIDWRNTVVGSYYMSQETFERDKRNEKTRNEKRKEERREKRRETRQRQEKC